MYVDEQGENVLETKIQEAKEIVLRNLETSEFTRVHVYCVSSLLCYQLSDVQKATMFVESEDGFEREI